MKIHTDNFDLKQTALSGQCFRMIMQDHDTARVIAKNRVLYIKDLGGCDLDLSCSKEEYNAVWKDYFDLDTDYGRFIDSVDRSDEFLTRASRCGSGIRILRQDPFETLISFIISQRKSIPAIQTSIEKLSVLCGDRIEQELFAFPTPFAIASLSDKELADCSLGYRASYVREAAERVASGEKDLEKMGELTDEELYDELISFCGVGKKVANCVMLFAYHRIASFPVDVWIQRIEDEHYGGRFPVERYQGFAGVLQQYMFYYVRTERGV